MVVERILGMKTIFSALVPFPHAKRRAAAVTARHLFALAVAATILTATALAPAPAAAADPPDKPVAAQSETTTPQAQAEADLPATTSAVVSGLEVRVTAPGTTASVEAVGPTAEVRVGTRLLVVEKPHLTLDGKPLGNLPPNARKVEVVLDKGALIVKADGKEAARAPAAQEQPR